MTERQTRTPDASLPIVAEGLRFLGYAGFGIVVVTGWVLTRYFSDIDLENTLLVEIFGYNNICVYFDYPPSNFVLPFLWAVTLVFLLAYLVAQWLHMRADVERGLIGARTYRTLTAMNAFEAFTLVAFSTIFAVSPEGWDHTLYIHTVPFFLLQFGMVSLAISNTWYGIASGYWKRLEFPRGFNTVAWLYCAVFAAAVAFKIPYGLNAMMGSPWWVNTDGLKSMAGSVDKLFFVCAAAIPMLKAGYLYFVKRDKVAVIWIDPRVALQGSGTSP